MVAFSSFTKFIVSFQLLTNVVVLLDVPYVRQVVGFVYLTFVPGLVILKTFRRHKGDFSETILFAIGLNIALLMLLGLFLNELFLLARVVSPLSTLPLLATMNIIVLLPLLLSHTRNASFAIDNSVLSYRLLLFIGIPSLSILGALAVNDFGSNSLLLLMIAIIAGLVSLGIIFKKLLPIKFYQIAIFAVAIALLFHSSLITNYLVGWDIHSEYHVFKSTYNAAEWNSTLTSWDDRIAKGNDMLSVTILPTIYSKITDIDGTWLFKILYPVLFAFVPLILYKLYSGRMKKEVAFLSVFFLISNLAFFGVDGVPVKQMVAEFFYVLLFLVIFAEKIGTFERNFLFVVFSAGLIVSHYSMSYIFMFMIFLTWLLPTVFNFLTHRTRGKSRITLSMVLTFFVIAFAWYIYTSESTSFNAILEVGGQISRNFLADFLNPSARTTTVLSGLGAGTATVSIGHQIGRIFFYIAELFIVVGVVQMLHKKEYAGSEEYAIVSVLNLGILLMAVIIPNFARYFRMERFYGVSILLLAPFFVLGGQTVFQLISRRRRPALALNLILIVLIPFFLFETGFIYEVTGDTSYSLPLSAYRTDSYDHLIVHKQEIYGVEWLSTYVQSELIYCDYFSGFHVLTSYGLLTAENIRLFSNSTESADSNSHTYLRWENIVKNKMVGEGLDGAPVPMNTSDISFWLDEQNMIYSNGGCEILIGTSGVSNSTQD